jgi:hypothetical protein
MLLFLSYNFAFCLQCAVTSGGGDKHNKTITTSRIFNTSKCYSYKIK